MTGGLWWGQDEESGGAAEAARPDPPAAAGPTSGGPRGTDPQGLRGRPEPAKAADRPSPASKRPSPKITPKGTADAPRKPAARPGPGPTAKAATPKPAKRSAAPLPRSRATRLAIDFIDVDAPVMDLRLDREGRLPAPPDDDPNLVGWYADGPSPGEQGTAVAVGHLDTATGPAVFAGLTELRRGRRVEIRRADGRTAVYTVDAVRSYEKDRFPNQTVYGARGRPELRLITCGGKYDRRTGYSGNVVVFAHLVEVRDAPTALARR
ncbi:class F sortase [Streptomyces sp. P17]|uniref:class F sortase n=1 Tax=Streptomyces sp. P17 TaxID=3074716 RepID=UPI0037DCAB2D